MWLCKNTTFSYQSIADDLRVSRRTISRYKDYKPQTSMYRKEVKTAETPFNHPNHPNIPNITEEELLQEIYEHYSGQRGDSKYIRPPNEIFKWINKTYWVKLSKLPRYKNKDYVKEINELIVILERNRQEKRDIFDLTV